MKHLYPTCPGVNTILTSTKKATLTIAIIFAALTSFSQVSIPELIFKNDTLISGASTAGKDGAVYLFRNVSTGIDAQVKVNGRSTSNVVLSDIDINNTGYDNAFQPLVNYTGGTNYGSNVNTDWYMEFQVSFFQHGTTTPTTVSGFDVSGLDIDGSTNIHEYISFYSLNTYTLENPTSLTVTTLTSGSTNIGKRFDGGTTEYDGINTAATKAEVTNHYVSTSSFMLRVGGKAKGPISIDNNGRQYSLWFKSFTYTNPVQSSLPVTLLDFTGQLNDKKVNLSWATAMEVNSSHFVIQRSTDGQSFDDEGILFTDGNSSVRKGYSFPDNVSNVTTPMVYYRLKMVDMDSKYRYSPIIVVRMKDDAQQLSVLVYPNPVVNDIRVTIPNEWQNKTVSYSVYNTNGGLVRQKVSANAGQTETFHVTDLPVGLYIIKAVNGNQSATQKFVKTI